MGSAPLDPDSDDDGLLDDASIVVGDSDPRYNEWAAAGFVYTESADERTFRGETTMGTDRLNPDSDGDGLNNGAENYFGTPPDQVSQGLVAGAVDTQANTFTFSHPINAMPADELIATYRWSTDMQTFYNDGQPNSEGTTTVRFVRSAPSDGMVTVTATATGVAIDHLFVDVNVTQN